MTSGTVVCRGSMTREPLTMYSISKGTYGTCVPVQHGPVDATSARLQGPRSTRRTRTCTNGGEVLVCALVKILVYVRWLRVLRGEHR